MNMKPGANNERVYRMAFASVYPPYVTKVEKKGRTKEELHTIIHWLTGYDEKAPACGRQARNRDRKCFIPRSGEDRLRDLPAEAG